MIKLLNHLILVSILILSSATVLAEAPANVQVSSAIIYVPLGKAKSTQGVLTLKNTGKEALSLVKVTSPFAKNISLSSSAKGASSSNSQTLSFELSKQSLTFEQIKYPITTGDDVELQLFFSDGKKMLVMAKARSMYDEKHSQ